MPHVRHVIPVACVSAICLTAPAAVADEPEPEPPPESEASLVRRIVDARQATWRWQRVMQRPRSIARVRARALSSSSTVFKERALAHWTRRARRAYKRAMNPPREREFRCIHRHEGPWDANTGNGYYGGLQMDLTFQRQYATRFLRKQGTADTWTPMEQIWVGERALREGRGFYPWPTAARRCGLI
jgi:hypothetical protein